jgi:hypothetical protein
MSKKDEALKLALEALEQIAAYRPLTFAECSDAEAVMRIAENAIPYLQEALAEQPAQQQEPEKDWGAVAEKHLAALKQSSKAITEEAAVNAVHKMAQARGLIDIGRIFTPEKEQPYPDNFIDALKYDVARRDSEALAEQPAKEKAPQSANCEAPGWINSDHTRRDDCNTEQPAQQEPVAWATRMGEYAHIHWGAKRPEYPMVYEVPLYTSPPASKPWVGLTDEEKSDLWCESTGRDCVNEDTHVFADSIEAKLREKNA